MLRAYYNKNRKKGYIYIYILYISDDIIVRNSRISNQVLNIRNKKFQKKLYLDAFIDIASNDNGINQREIKHINFYKENIYYKM